jgi:hypothetical protein
MILDVRIERLVLEGIELSPPEREQLQIAFEANLADLLAAEPPAPAADRAAATVHRTLDAAPHSDPEVFGGRLAEELDAAIRAVTS